MSDVRNAYREGAARGGTPVGQVVMLYEQIVEDLRQAARAIDENQIENRTRAINHAIVIISHLQGNLNFEAGGEVARNLERFYAMLRQKLTEAHFRASRQILEEQIHFLLDLREAWSLVDRTELTRAAASTPSAQPSASQPTTAVSDWKA